MKEVKSPKKPLLYYYGIVLLILVIFNAVSYTHLDVYKRQSLDCAANVRML